MSKVYEIITKKITDKLEQSEIPWEKPWNSSGLPKSLVSGRHYRGINILSLALEGFGSPWWLTKKKCEQLGGLIREGQRYTPCMYWFFRDRESKGEGPADSDDSKGGKDYRRGILRFYQVYNVEQCTGLTVPEPEKKLEFCPIEECERIVEEFKGRPDIKFGGERACYSPSADTIHLPREHKFKSESAYYATYFHEAVHSTGHAKRLHRKTLVDLCPYGSSNYSKEELVAELGASYLCGMAGIDNDTLDNSAAYIQGWLKALNNDSRMLVYAAGQAQKAVDHITGNTPDKSCPAPKESLRRSIRSPSKVVS